MSSNLVFTVLDTIDSTNNYAMKQIHEDLAQHGMAWFAKNQRLGKGQRGKTWLSQSGENILLSISIQPNAVFQKHPFHFSAMVALICKDFISKHICEKISIKWPNDLYIGDRKAGGILIENSFRGKDWKWAVIGVGININQTIFNPEIKNPVSFTQITKKNYDAIAMAKELHQQLVTAIDETKKPDAIITLYNQHLYKKNEKIRFVFKDNIFEETITQVDQNGKLVTELNTYNFGEIEWLLD
jgi:BirA family biotin operon repressor/biotin-[acetyl-CoA-carboxylase] ligase